MATIELAGLMSGIPLDGWRTLPGCMYAWIDGPYTVQLYQHGFRDSPWFYDAGERVFGPIEPGHLNWEWAY